MFEETQTTQTGGDSNVPAYSPLAKVQCISASDTRQRRKNMRWCMHENRNIRRVQGMPVPWNADHIAIVAGGPTLNETYKQVMEFKYVMSCGSSHDHVLSLGIKPTYHVECDPDLAQIGMYKNSCKETKYLICSRCDKSMFTALKGRDVYLWHMWEAEVGKPAYRGEQAFVCGATVVLSAIPLALWMRFKHLHFFGFDSSFNDKENHHAYPQPETAQMMTVKVGDALKGREFLTTATWAGQVQQFEDMLNHWKFKATIYGDSMMAEMMKYRALEMAK